MIRLLSLSAQIIRVFLGISMAALMVMMLAIVADVFMRFAFNAPITGVYDIVEISLVIAVFYSLGAVISGLHEILIDLIDHMVSAKIVLFLQRLSAVLSALVLIFIFTSMITPAMQSYQYNELRLELNMPTWIMWAIALIGMAGGVMASIVKVFKPLNSTVATTPKEAASS